MNKMLKNYKNGLLISALLLLLFCLTPNVYAANSSDWGKAARASGECENMEKENETCKTDKSKEHERPNCTKNKNAKYYGVKFENDGRKYKITAKKGTFKVKVTSNTGNYNDEKTLRGGENEVIFTIPKGIIEGNISVKLSKTDDQCMAGCYVENNCFRVGESPTEFHNGNYNGSCAEYRNFYNSASDKAKSVLNKMVGYKYCSNATNKMTISNSLLTKNNGIMKTEQEIADLIADFKSNPLPDIDEGIPERTNVNLTGDKLICNAFSDEINENKYYHIETNNVNDVCSVQCREVLTVKYDAPQSVTGGQCFTYSVQVQSKVECSTIVKDDTPPKRPPVCYPYPICNGYAGYQHQGGPNDNFDDCVSACDGGKYSQKCIDKCYKTVYENKSSGNKKLSFGDQLNKNSVKQLAGCPKFGSVEALMDYKAENPGGRYYWGSDGQIHWDIADSPEKKKDYGNPCGQYGVLWYYQNYAYAHRLLYGSDYGARKYLGPYRVITSGSQEGFRKAWNCTETCYLTGCSKSSGAALGDNEANKQYLKDLRTYRRKLRACRAKEVCKTKTATFHMEADIVQNKENKTITYDASNSSNKSNNKGGADPDIIVKEDGECYGHKDGRFDYLTKINFPGTWRTSKDLSTYLYKKPKTQYMLVGKDNEFCIPNETPNVNEKWWIWDVLGKDDKCKGPSRPNLTDGVKAQIESARKNNIRASIKNFGYFGWNIPNIKCFYAVYKQNGGETPGLEFENGAKFTGSGSKATDSDGRVKCAGVETCPNGNVKKIDKCICGVCTPTDETAVDPTNVFIKTVKSSDLFPNRVNSADGSGIIKKLTYDSKYENSIMKVANINNVGFNWSLEATNLNNSAYPIVPTALIEHSKQIGDVYKNSSELDYHFKLTKERLDTIRSDNKNNLDNNFIALTSTGSYEPRGAVGYTYVSKLIDKISGERKGNQIGYNNAGPSWNYHSLDPRIDQLDNRYKNYRSKVKDAGTQRLAEVR